MDYNLDDEWAGYYSGLLTYFFLRSQFLKEANTVDMRRNLMEWIWNGNGVAVFPSFISCALYDTIRTYGWLD